MQIMSDAAVAYLFSQMKSLTRMLLGSVHVLRDLGATSHLRHSPQTSSHTSFHICRGMKAPGSLGGGGQCDTQQGSVFLALPPQASA